MARNRTSAATRPSTTHGFPPARPRFSKTIRNAANICSILTREPRYHSVTFVLDCYVDVVRTPQQCPISRSEWMTGILGCGDLEALSTGLGRDPRPMGRKEKA